jgi:hypothetical protein
MYGGRVIDSYDRRIIYTYMKEYFGDFVFDSFQPFHFFVDTNKPLKYDYFIPEIRDFLSAKQRWLLKEANISVFNLFFFLYAFIIYFRLNHKLNIISKNFCRINNFYLKMFFLINSFIFQFFVIFI